MTSKQSSKLLTGIISIIGACSITTAVIGLKLTFGYPSIIRAEPKVILERIHETQDIVPLIYYFGFGGTGICTILFAILLAQILKENGDELWSGIGKTCGIISGVLLYVGIIRYSILFPRLAELRNSNTYDPKAIDFIFTVMNTYVGESVAEHSQFLFTSLMLIFFGISSIRTRLLPLWLSISSFAVASILLVGNLEHFGFKFAFIFNRTGAKLVALWLLILGIILIYNSIRTKVNHTNCEN